MISKERIVELCLSLQRYSIYGLVFFIPFYFAWFQENYSVFDLNKSVVLHSLLNIIIVLWLVVITLARKFSWGGNKILGLLGTAVGVTFLISTIFSIDSMISLFGSYERLQGFYNLLAYLGVYFFVLVTIKDRNQLLKLISFFILGSLFTCVYGLVQAFGLDFLKWGEVTVRIFSTFGQPNFLAHYLITVLPFTVYGVFYLSRNIYYRICFIILSSINIACIIFTYSRSAWLALIIGIFLFIIWTLLRNRKKLWVALLISFTILSLCIVIKTNISGYVTQKFPNYNTNVIDRLVSVMNVNIIGSSTARLLYWKAAYQGFMESSLERKLFGYGPDVHGLVFAKYYQSNWAFYEKINSFPDRAHNFIFDILLQFGIIGFLAFSFFSGYIIWNLSKYAWRENHPKNYWLAVCFLFALIAYGINNLFSFSLVGMNVILYSLLGGAWILANQFKQTEIKITFFQSASLAVLGITSSFFLFILFYFYNIKPLIADYYFYEAKKGEARSNCRMILDNMEKVLEWYPSSQYYNRSYIHLGTNCFIAVTEKASQEQLAANLLEQASFLPKENMQYSSMLDVARMYAMLGYYIDTKYYQEADIYYQQLILKSPNITVNYQDYGRMKMWEGKYSEAEELFLEGIHVSPPVDPPPPGYPDDIYYQVSYFYNLLGGAYKAEKKYDKALEAFHTAIRIKPNIVSYYKDLSDLYYQQHDLDKAIYFNKKGFELEPTKAEWPYFLALLYNEKGDLGAAREYNRQALDIDPENEKAKKLMDILNVKK